MSDTKQAGVSDGPTSVEIPLDNISHNSSRKSSTSSSSTSSFENVNTSKPDNIVESQPLDPASTPPGHPTATPPGQPAATPQDPATVEVEELEPKPGPRGALTFKTTSLDDPTYYAQTTSSSNSPSLRTTRSQGRTPTKMNISHEDRDPENVNEIVKIKFEEVFAEPDGIYSFGTIWGASHKIFTDTKLWCYKFLSAMCAVPCAFCWGLHFACLSFCQIWYYQPGIRSFSIQVRPLAKVYGICIKSFIEPCFETLGKIFSSIRVHVAKD